MTPEEIKKAMDVVAAEDGKAALEIVRNLIASLASDGGDAGAAPAGDAMAAAGETAAPDAPPDPMQAASIAASAELVRITGAATPGEAVARIAAMFTSVQTLEADRAALDLSERQGLVAQLVTAGAEVPATAWEGDDKSKRQPVKRLMDEPIAELRERVKLVTAAAGTRRPASGARPPVAGPTPDAAPRPLKREEIAACARLKITEDEFRARMASAVTRNQ